MNGFRDLAMDIARDNGLTNASILFQRSVLTLPGFFRPTKQWDMLVLNNGELVATGSPRTELVTLINATKYF